MKKQVIKQFLKFAVVGVFGTLIHVGLLYFFTEFLNIYYILSSFFGYFVALSIGFIVNKVWTFEESIRTRAISKYSKFFAVCMFSLGISLILLYALTEFFGIHYIVSQILARGVALIINFLGNSLWTFRK